MLWQQDNDQAANGTMAHSARTSATHNELSADMRITMTMDNRKILMTKIMMMRMKECRADPGRMMKILMMKITGKEVSVKTITRMNKRIIGDKIRATSKEGVPARASVA